MAADCGAFRAVPGVCARRCADRYPGAFPHEHADANPYGDTDANAGAYARSNTRAYGNAQAQAQINGNAQAFGNAGNGDYSCPNV